MRRLLQKAIRNPDFWIPCLLTGSGILFFADFLFTSGNFYYRDILNFHYPMHRLLMEAFSRWEWPLWNPYLYLGQPMLANANFMALYPTNLLNLVCSFNYSFKLHFIIHPLLAGPGLYFLARRLGIQPLGALAGAIAYQFSGPMLSFLNLYNIVPVVALMPWVGWAFVRALESATPKRILLFGFLLALQVVAMEPLTFQCTLFLVGGLSIYRFVEAEKRGGVVRKVLVVASVGAAIALAFSAVQVLPSLELIRHSHRGAGLGFSAAAGWSTHPMDLLSALFPGFYGNPYRVTASAVWGELLHSGRESYLVSYFIGALTLLLGGVSLLHPRRRLTYCFLGLGAASVFLALGQHNPVYRWLFDHVPLFSLGRFPCKYFLLSALVLSILAALGYEAAFCDIQVQRRRSQKATAIVILALAGSAAAAIWILCWTLDPQGLQAMLKASSVSFDTALKDFAAISAQLKKSFLFSAIYLSAGVAVMSCAVFSKKLTLLAPMFLILQIAELAPANLRLSPLISDKAIESVPEVNLFLQQQVSGEMGRVMPVDFMIRIPIQKLFTPSDSMAWSSMVTKLRGLPMYGILNGIQYSICDSVDNLNTMESDMLFRKFVTLPAKVSVALAQRTNTRFIITQGKMTDDRVRLIRTFFTGTDLPLNIYAVEDAFPRAYLASGVIGVRSQEEALAAFLDPAFTAKSNVILERPDLNGRMGADAFGMVRILDYRSNYVRCQIEAASEAHLVLLDSWYPGWSALVDGRRADLHRANYAFRAVPVPAGTHIVEFRYRPYSFYLGLALSTLTILAVLIYLSLGVWPFGRQSQQSVSETRGILS